MEVYIDDETKLTLHGLQQHYVKLQDREKNRKLFDLLDVLEFNQVSLLCYSLYGLPCFIVLVLIVGDHLCQVCTALHCTHTTAGGAELPCYLHPQRNASRGKVSGVFY